VGFSSPSSPRPSPTTTAPDAAASWHEVVQCLRDNGMPNLPDPRIDGDGQAHFPGRRPGRPATAGAARLRADLQPAAGQRP
jgi:hypothetical protein